MNIFIFLLGLLAILLPINSFVVFESCDNQDIVCKSLRSAKSCNAVTKCIENVWIHKEFVPDHDSICQICLDMVKKARDQLESNETRQDIKDVFEGTCKLMPIKPVRIECIKLADDYAPELVEMLSAQMNPGVVCSVAGLCNNVEIDKKLEEIAISVRNNNNIYSNERIDQSNKQLSCTGCNKIGKIITKKFQSTNPDKILDKLIEMCENLSSYSDACSNIMILHFNKFYDRIKNTLNSESICHMSGVCNKKYHQHDDDDDSIEIRPLSNVGVITTNVNNDDIPCELCVQLLHHLKDVLIANTTELEFKMVLKGLCKQFEDFKDECLNIVDEYYSIIYNTLVNQLNNNQACIMIGVCKNLYLYDKNKNEYIKMPQIPPQTINVSIKEKSNTKLLLGDNEPKLTNDEILGMQLPIDRLLIGPMPNDLISKEIMICPLCEYFIHVAQTALADNNNEEKIKAIFHKKCQLFPNSLIATCDQFIFDFGDALIALLIQEFDPTVVCPKLRLCPNNKDVEIFAPQEVQIHTNAVPANSDKPTCPLCLLAVQQAKEMIKNNKTEAKVRNALDHLCEHLPLKLKSECVDFINNYSKELIKMLIDDFTTQQICVYLELCDHKEPDMSTIHINAVPANSDKPSCPLCLFTIERAEEMLKDNKTEADVRNALDHVCEHVPSKLKSECVDFINNYSKELIKMLIDEFTPQEICVYLALCNDKEPDMSTIFISIDFGGGNIDTNEIHDDTINGKLLSKNQNQINPKCTICQSFVKRVENDIINNKSTDQIIYALNYECSKILKYKNKCKTFVKQHIEDIINYVHMNLTAKAICRNLSFCLKVDSTNDDEHNQDETNIPLVHVKLQATNNNIQTNSECELCEMIMHIIEKEITDANKNISNVIDKICYKLKNSNKEKCKKFIDKYEKYIIKMIDTIPPKLICKSILLCTYNEMTEEIAQCGICYESVIELGNQLKQLENDYNTDHLIDVSCNSVPAKFYKNCSEMITYYGPSILNQLFDDVDLSEICKNIGMCTDNNRSGSGYVQLEKSDVSSIKPEPEQRSKQVYLVGDNECTYGPSYWCENKENAAKCHATAYCDHLKKLNKKK